MNNRSFMAVIAFASMVAYAGMAWAQSSNVNMAVQITNARKANAKLMRQYTWNSRTEIIEGGQVKDIRIELVNYAPNGQLQRSLLNDQGSRLPFGFLRRAIAEARKKQLEDYLAGLRGLIEQYTLPTTEQILNFMNRAATSGPDAGGLFQFYRLDRCADPANPESSGQHFFSRRHGDGHRHV
jgi:hypothetical protein